jgi:hypothetical protein
VRVPLMTPGLSPSRKASSWLREVPLLIMVIMRSLVMVKKGGLVGYSRLSRPNERRGGGLLYIPRICLAYIFVGSFLPLTE